MATTGKEKWKRYFQGKEINTKIKGPSNGRPVSVYIGIADNEKIDTLDDGHPISVPDADKYEPRYLIKYKKGSKKLLGYVSQNAVAKPIASKGATENLAVRAETLILGGKLTKENYAGKPVQVRKFANHRMLAKSILMGLKKNKNVSEGIVEVFEKFLKPNSRYDRLEWTSEIDSHEINELGKYAGELIIGLLCLKNNKSVFSKSFYQGGIAAFCVPDDPSFVGVDSFLLMKNKTIIPISSKYGVGAKASFFANLLPKAVAYNSKLKPSILKQVVKSTKQAGITKEMLDRKKGAKDILYWHGVNVILKLKNKKPLQIFQDIKKGKMTKDAKVVISAIKKYRYTEPKIKAALPKSVTAFFSREIARQLNNDKKSIVQILEILSGKNFWQANLDINKWRKGDVYYKMVNSGDSKVSIIGSKSSMTDIDAKQGMLNYEIKLP